MIRKIIGFSCIFFSSAASSAYQCQGMIETINQGRDGAISVVSTELFGDSEGRRICYLTDTWKEVSPEVCMGWLSKLLSVKATGTKMTVQYNDSGIACSGQATWDGAESPWALWESY